MADHGRSQGPGTSGDGFVGGLDLAMMNHLTDEEFVAVMVEQRRMFRQQQQQQQQPPSGLGQGRGQGQDGYGSVGNVGSVGSLAQVFANDSVAYDGSTNAASAMVASSAPAPAIPTAASFRILSFGKVPDNMLDLSTYLRGIGRKKDSPHPPATECYKGWKAEGGNPNTRQMDYTANFYPGPSISKVVIGTRLMRGWKLKWAVGGLPVEVDRRQYEATLTPRTKEEAVRYYNEGVRRSEAGEGAAEAGTVAVEASSAATVSAVPARRQQLSAVPVFGNAGINTGGNPGATVSNVGSSGSVGANDNAAALESAATNAQGHIAAPDQVVSSIVLNMPKRLPLLKTARNMGKYKKVGPWPVQKDAYATWLEGGRDPSVSQTEYARLNYPGPSTAIRDVVIPRMEDGFDFSRAVGGLQAGEDIDAYRANLTPRSEREAILLYNEAVRAIEAQERAVEGGNPSLVASSVAAAAAAAGAGVAAGAGAGTPAHLIQGRQSQSIDRNMSNLPMPTVGSFGTPRTALSDDRTDLTRREEMLLTAKRDRFNVEQRGAAEKNSLERERKDALVMRYMQQGEMEHRINNEWRDRQLRTAAKTTRAVQALHDGFTEAGKQHVDEGIESACRHEADIGDTFVAGAGDGRALSFDGGDDCENTATGHTSDRVAAEAEEDNAAMNN